MCTALHGAGLLQIFMILEILTRRHCALYLMVLGCFHPYLRMMISLPVVYMWHYWRIMVSRDVLASDEDCSLVYTMLGMACLWKRWRL